MSERKQRAETYYAGAYWGPRKESAEECAKRAETMLSMLAGIDPSFARWFKQARSLKESLKRPVDPTRAALEQWIQRGAMRSDGGAVMEDLGYSVLAWNGERDEYDDSDFRLSCGGWAGGVNNACVFKLPSKGPNAERVLTTHVLANLVRCMAVAWEPDWAVAMSHMHRDTVSRTPQEQGPYVAWVTYIARRRGTVSSLPAPVRIESVEDKGTLIILTPGRFTAANPGDVELAAQVRDCLSESELFR